MMNSTTTDRRAADSLRCSGSENPGQEPRAESTCDWHDLLTLEGYKAVRCGASADYRCTVKRESKKHITHWCWAHAWWLAQGREFKSIGMVRIKSGAGSPSDEAERQEPRQ